MKKIINDIVENRLNRLRSTNREYRNEYSDKHNGRYPEEDQLNRRCIMQLLEIALQDPDKQVRIAAKLAHDIRVKIQPQVQIGR